jgi:hypothetical protein
MERSIFKVIGKGRSGDSGDVDHPKPVQADQVK